MLYVCIRDHPFNVKGVGVWFFGGKFFSDILRALYAFKKLVFVEKNNVTTTCCETNFCCVANQKTIAPPPFKLNVCSLISELRGLFLAQLPWWLYNILYKSDSNDVIGLVPDQDWRRPTCSYGQDCRTMVKITSTILNLESRDLSIIQSGINEKSTINIPHNEYALSMMIITKANYSYVYHLFANNSSSHSISQISEGYIIRSVWYGCYTYT